MLMQDKLNIAVFVDYDNIEIGLKSTLRREFDVSLALDALKERGDIVAKFAYANWGRQDGATRQMAESAVQMVQRIPSPRGDKNGADINLALDALEMAFTHTHVNAFAIVSGDSDFIPLVNKLKEYGKTVFVVGGKAFTSTILQQNCHEFISFESLLDATGQPAVAAPPEPRQQRQRTERPERGDRRQRPAPLDLNLAMPLVERALQVLERRAVQPQLGLLKSTMLQLDPAFNERAFGASSFSDFVEKLKRADLVEVSGQGGRYVIERKGAAQLEHGCPVDDLAGWFKSEQPRYDISAYGFQEFSEFLNYAQDKLVVRMEPHEEMGVMMVHLGAEFYPPAETQAPVVETRVEVEEEYEPQPYVEGQPTIFEPNPPPPKTKKAPARKRTAKAPGAGAGRRPRRKK